MKDSEVSRRLNAVLQAVNGIAAYDAYAILEVAKANVSQGYFREIQNTTLEMAQKKRAAKIKRMREELKNEPTREPRQ